MPYLYAEVLPAAGCVRLVLDSTGLNAYGARIRRYTVNPATSGAVGVLVRTSGHTTTGSTDPTPEVPLDLLDAGGGRVWYDVEAPLDRPVWYRAELINLGSSPVQYLDATALVALRHDRFETPPAGWTYPQGGAGAHDTTAPLFGAGSLRYTAPGAVAVVNAQTTPIPGIDPARRYIAEAWVRNAGAAPADVQVVMDWRDGANTPIAGSTGVSGVQNVPVGATAYRRTVHTPPAGAAYGVLRVRWAGTPPAGAAIVVDEVRLLDPGTGAPGAGTPVTVPADGAGWLRDPLAPRLDVRLGLLPDPDCPPEQPPADDGVLFLTYAGEQRNGGGARFDAVDQATPTVATGRRKAPTSTLTIATLTAAAVDQVHELLAAGRVLLFDSRAEFGVGQRYIDVGDVTTGRLPGVSDLRRPERVVDLPHAVVASPGGPGEGLPGIRYADLCDRYATWDAFDAARLSGVDVLLGRASTGGGVA